MSTAVAPSTLEASTLSASWADRALSLVSTMSLALAGGIVMLLVLATPGQPMEHLFQTTSCGVIA